MIDQSGRGGRFRRRPRGPGQNACRRREHEAAAREGSTHSGPRSTTEFEACLIEEEVRQCVLSYASEEGELLDALENVVSFVPLLRGARAFSQA